MLGMQRLRRWTLKANGGHGLCLSTGTKRRINVSSDGSSERNPVEGLGDRSMADIAMKRVPQRGPPIREQLKRMDDAEVVASFLDGEERAFQELVERYQTRLLNFIY